MDECVWRFGSTKEDGTKGLSTRCAERGCNGFVSSIGQCREFMPLQEQLVKIRKKEDREHEERE